MLILSLVALIGGCFGQNGVLGEAVLVRKGSWGMLFWSERGPGGSCFGQKEVLGEAVLVMWWIRTCLCRFGEGPWWVEVRSVRVPGGSKCDPYVQVQVW